jgi:hypothetical protein
MIGRCQVFGPDITEEYERVRDRIENGIIELVAAGKHFVFLAQVATGALVICAAALVWIATK